MKIFSKSAFSTSTSLATAAIIALAAANAAQAQEVAAPAETAATANEEGTIVVTGSRIVRPGVESTVPLTAIGGEEFFQQGQNSVGDTLNDLPQLRSTYAQQNPGAGIGIAGLNLLDLRGLGTVRTLVLVNGRRHVAADILSSASSPDVNTIPNDLIERTEIITGGSSAVYGSDAIAGVVNFVLKRDFNGLQLRANAGISEAGFGGNQYVSAMAGRNFADGRGNITVHAEYARQDRIYASDTPWYFSADGFATVDADSPGLANGSDGFPDAVFVRDIRSATTHRYGLVAIPQTNAGAACGRGTLANNGATNTAGTAFHCNYIFSPQGRLVPQTGTRIGTGPGGSFLGGNGQTSREGTQLSILPFNERFNTNLLARFEFTPALEAFVEAKFVRVNAVGNQLGPTFLNNSAGSLGNDPRLAPRLDNPFLNAADRTTIRDAILASGCGYAPGTSLGTVTCRALTSTELTNIANGSYRFLFARNLTDSEDRDERFKRDTYRIVGGLRGTFNDDWRYEISANYGKFNETVDMRGFVNRQRFLLSLDAGINPNTGQIQCRSQFDPAAAVGAPNYLNSAATLAADIAACVPYNPFGQADNAAAVAYFKLPIINRSSISQFDLQGFVAGDTSSFFNLPGGPVSFVVGGEYRAEQAYNDSDPAADTGISNSVFLGDVLNARAMKVQEAFAEISVPLLKDKPFFHDLTLRGAGRLSDYNSAVGTVYTYNAGVEWAPFESLRLRGNYGRAIRAPNISESGFPSVPNFANNFVDPCNVNAIGRNPIRSANCEAELSAVQRANLAPSGYSLGIVSGSNPDLKEETSDSYTAGVVFTPKFIPGLTLTADYYHITVKNVISTLSAQTIVDSCYDSPGRSSPLCDAFKRNMTSANGPLGELPGQILFKSLLAGPQNFARRIREGVDIEAGYRRDLGGDAKLSTRLIYSHQFTNSNFQNPVLPDYENRLLEELGDPKDEFRWNVDLSKGPFTLGYVMRYIGPMFTGLYEDFNVLPGACTTNTTPQVCPPLNADSFAIQKYPAVIYHNARFEWDVEGAGFGKDFTFYFGVDNFTNKLPPFGTTATGGSSAIYNIRGRNWYAGVTARF